MANSMKNSISTAEFHDVMKLYMDEDTTVENSNGEMVYISYLGEKEAKNVSFLLLEVAGQYQPNAIQHDKKSGGTAIHLSIPVDRTTRKISVKDYYILMTPHEENQYMLSVLVKDIETLLN